MRTLWLAFVAASLALTGLLGWFVARRGLAPLRAMREQGRRSSPPSASTTACRWIAVPVELAELAESLNDMLARLEESFPAPVEIFHPTWRTNCARRSAT
jgi:two-component system heavy metal sensor histidine kinase CusS